MTRALIKISKLHSTFMPKKDYKYLKLKTFKSEMLMKRYIVKATNKYFKRIILTIKDISIQKDPKFVCVNKWAGQKLSCPHVIGLYKKTRKIEKNPAPHTKKQLPKPKAKIL